MRALYFYSVIFGFFAGILAGGQFDFSLEAKITVLIAAIFVLVFLLWHSRKKEKPLAYPLLFFCIFSITFSFGAIRMYFAEKNFTDNPLTGFLLKNASFVGEVTDESGANNNAIIKVYAISEKNTQKSIMPEKILVNNLSPSLSYGDIVVFSGKLAMPKNFKTQSGSEFDYTTYLKKSGIRYVVSFPTLLHQEKNDSFSIRAFLYNIKNWFIGNIQSVVPEPDASLATGVTIAGKGALPKDVQDDFIKAGIIHIVVLSGYNIAIVIRAMLLAFGSLGKKTSITIAATAIVLFVIATGGAAPVVRSAIMAAVTLIGMLTYKDILPNRALFGAAFLMILLNPFIMLHDASFILSFLATFAIVNIVPLTLPYFSFMTERFQIRQILSETFATQIFVLPYLLFEMGRLSIIAPVSNIIVLPLIPYIMFLAFVVGVFAFVPLLGLPFAGGLLILTSFVIGTAQILGNLPFSSFNISISLWIMVAMYVLYFVAGIYLSRNKKGLTEQVR